MFKREEERPGRVGAAPSAFLHLSDEGAVELGEQQSSARRAFALLLAGLVLLAAPLFWVNSAQGSDQPLAVKSNSGSNTGPGSGDNDDDGADDTGGDGDDSVDTPTGTTANTGPSNSATNTAQNQGPGNGDDDQNDDTTNGEQSNGTRENSATNTANTGDGPNTNTKD